MWPALRATRLPISQGWSFRGSRSGAAIPLNMLNQGNSVTLPGNHSYGEF